MIIDNSGTAKNVTAIITAAGKGTRMQSDINKQYIEVAGIPVLARTVNVFQQCEQIDDIIIVVNEEDINFCRRNIVQQYNFSKVRSLVSGGAERQISVFKGLCAVGDNCGIVLIHDGARPFVTNKNVIDCINGVKNFSACGIGVRLKDTVKMSDEQDFVTDTPDRSRLWSIQTPQGFEYNLIKAAHDKAYQNGYVGTDDMVLVEMQGIPVKIIEGNYRNIKITTQEDLIIGEAFAANP